VEFDLPPLVIVSPICHRRCFGSRRASFHAPGRGSAPFHRVLHPTRFVTARVPPWTRTTHPGSATTVNGTTGAYLVRCL